MKVIKFLLLSELKQKYIIYIIRITNFLFLIFNFESYLFNLHFKLR